MNLGYHYDLIEESMRAARFHYGDSIRIAQMANGYTDTFQEEKADFAYEDDFSEDVLDNCKRLHFGQLPNHYCVKSYFDNLIAGTYKAIKEAKFDEVSILCILGTTLHINQDFYAHSNWAEMNMPYRTGIKDATYFDLCDSNKNKEIREHINQYAEEGMQRFGKEIKENDLATAGYRCRSYCYLHRDFFNENAELPDCTHADYGMSPKVVYECNQYHKEHAKRLHHDDGGYTGDEVSGIYDSCYDSTYNGLNKDTAGRAYFDWAYRSAFKAGIQWIKLFEHWVNKLSKVEEEGKAHYAIRIATGDIDNADTKAGISVRLYGTKGESETIQIKKPGNNSYKKHFVQGGVDYFDIYCQDLGDLTHIQLENDNSKSAPGWFVKQVNVMRYKEEKEWVVRPNCWLVKGSDVGLSAKFKFESQGLFLSMWERVREYNNKTEAYVSSNSKILTNAMLVGAYKGPSSSSSVGMGVSNLNPFDKIPHLGKKWKYYMEIISKYLFTFNSDWKICPSEVYYGKAYSQRKHSGYEFSDLKLDSNNVYWHHNKEYKEEYNGVNRYKLGLCNCFNKHVENSIKSLTDEYFNSDKSQYEAILSEAYDVLKLENYDYKWLRIKIPYLTTYEETEDNDLYLKTRINDFTYTHTPYRDNSKPKPCWTILKPTNTDWPLDIEMELWEWDPEPSNSDDHFDISKLGRNLVFTARPETETIHVSKAHVLPSNIQYNDWGCVFKAQGNFDGDGEVSTAYIKAGFMSDKRIDFVIHTSGNGTDANVRAHIGPYAFELDNKEYNDFFDYSNSNFAIDPGKNFTKDNLNKFRLHRDLGDNWSVDFASFAFEDEVFTSEILDREASIDNNLLIDYNFDKYSEHAYPTIEEYNSEIDTLSFFFRHPYYKYGFDHDASFYVELLDKNDNRIAYTDIDNFFFDDLQHGNVTFLNIKPKLEYRACLCNIKKVKMSYGWKSYFKISEFELWANRKLLIREELSEKYDNLYNSTLTFEIDDISEIITNIERIKRKNYGLGFFSPNAILKKEVRVKTNTSWFKSRKLTSW